MWTLSFISEEDFTKHVKKTIDTLCIYSFPGYHWSLHSIICPVNQAVSVDNDNSFSHEKLPLSIRR